MPANMAGRHGRHVLDPITGVRRPAAEIHVLEPHRVKLLVETSQALPNVTARHEECSRGLLDRPGLVKIAIQITIVAVYGVPGPQPVDPEQLKNQRGGSGEAAERETLLRLAVFADQLA